MLEFLSNLWKLFVDMSFYLVIGILFTGILHAFVKRSFILKQVGGNTFSSVVKASVVGVPLPLCSCGVVPTALYIGKNGASKGATVSFLTSTPQTGLDSIIATYGMLGGFFAAYRAVVAFISGIIAGCVTNLFCKNDKKEIKIEKVEETSCCTNKHNEEFKKDEVCCCDTNKEEVKKEIGCSINTEQKPKLKVTSFSCSTKPIEIKETSCCSTIKEHKVVSSCCSSVKETKVESSCCCTSNLDNENKNLKFIDKVKSVFTYGFGEFLDEIALNFVIGIIIAALITTLVPTDLFTTFSNPLLQMLLMLVIGIPMYVCSTSSIPIAVALVIKGITPGAAFVFLFTGPVTNIASLTMLTKNIGKKVMAIYLSCVAICSIAFGLLLDLIIEITNYEGIDDLLTHSHHNDIPTYQIVVACLFGALVLYSLMKRFTKNKIVKG